MEDKAIMEKLTNLMNPERLQHSIRVMESAKELAILYNVDVGKAALAGLLHDCAKGFQGDELIQKSKEYGLELDRISLNQTGLIHGPLGAKVANRLFEVEDQEVLGAIEYHTYGREDMTILEKIIYLADLIEPERDFSGVDELRTLALKDLDKALLKALDDTIALMISRGGLIHPNTLKARNNIVLSQEAQ